MGPGPAQPHCLPHGNAVRDPKPDPYSQPQQHSDNVAIRDTNVVAHQLPKQQPHGRQRAAVVGGMGTCQVR